MKRPLFYTLAALLLAATTKAQNPVVSTWFTTDPAPMVHGNTLYVYTGHDEGTESIKADFFWMQEWRVYGTEDMVNWRDYGSPLAIESFSWGDDRAWAPQCIERNGKFYFYVPLHSKNSGGMAIGVAVGDTPYGPFKDPLGKPLYENGSWDHIDPTVMIDDDGQAWLYWGNPNLYYCKLNKDMISIDGEVRKMDKSNLKGYTEGPWIQKRSGKYYMMYAADGIPENIAYAMSSTPVGPWDYKGIIMPKNEQASFTNHSGLVDFKGHSYFFYHSGWLGGGYGRSICVEEFKYNADGTIPTIHASRDGVAPIATFSPWRRVEAEVMASKNGNIHSQPNGVGNVYLSDIHNGDWIKLREVDFGNRQAKQLDVRAASALRGGTLELRADSLKGQKICEVAITETGGWEKFNVFSTKDVKVPAGKHDLYLVFKGRKGPELFTLDWWEMK